MPHKIHFLERESSILDKQHNAIHLALNKYAFLLSILLASFFATSCYSSRNTYDHLPHRYQKQGLVTSNTYQVHLEIIAESREEAIKLAKPEAIIYMYNMVIKEPSLNIRMGFYGRSQIKKLIIKKGEIVYLIPTTEEKWKIVFQIYKRGLWDYIRHLR